MYAAILFDLDNTLIARDAALRSALLAEVGDPAAVEQLMVLDGSGYGDIAGMVEHWSRLVGRKRNVADIGIAIASRLRPAPTLLRALADLARVTAIGIITNGAGHTQRRKWAAAGLDQVVPTERLWISDELGVAKPDPAIFGLALSVLGTTPSDSLFIGDHLVIDVEGARAAGLEGRHCVQPVDERFIRNVIGS